MSESYRSLDHALGSVTLLLQLGRKAHVHATLATRTDSTGRLQKYPKIHVRTGEETSGLAPTPHKVLGPISTGEESRETPERAPSNSQGDWPFLRPPERVPEVPVVSREHLPQLEKIQEVLPSRRDEAHFR